MDIFDFFKNHPKAAVAFSGGVDSSYLLYAAVKSGADVKAYYVRTAFQPLFELRDAEMIAEQTGAELSVVELDIFPFPEITSNPENRCYHCKKLIFSTILEHAVQDGYTVLLDGTNASDDESDRPGTKALHELSVLSPLRECGLTKEMIRQLSREAGLFTWDKPAYACLATRIPAGEPITQDKLEKTELAEEFLSHLGFSDFRVRMRGDAALIQVPSEQMEKVLIERNSIVRELGKYYSAISLDLAGRK